MSDEQPKLKPNLGDAMTNWRRSELPLLARFSKAMRNYSRRFAIPPKNCCGNYDEPGCCIACAVPEQGAASGETRAE